MGILDGLFGGGVAAYPQPEGQQLPPGLGPQQPSGFMDRLNQGFSNPLVQFGLGLASGKTPQEGIGNAGRASLYANELQKADQTKKAGQLAAYQAAIAQGASPAQAQAYALSPDVAKMLQPQFHTIKTGLFGEETPIFVSPLGGIRQAQVGGGGGDANTGSPRSAGALSENYDPDTGKDEAFLKSVEDKYGSTVSKSIKDITEGRMPAMGRNLQQLIPLASRYDKNFTGMQDYQTRLTTARSFAGGKDAETVKSYNQAINHANQLWDLIPKVEGADVGGPLGKIINTPYSAARSATNTQYQSDLKEYQNLTQALAGELMKASRGTGSGSLEEIRAWKAGADAANSGPEMRGAIRGAMDFLHGAMDSSARKKSEGMKSQFAPSDLLDPNNAKSFERIRGSTEAKKESGNGPAVGEVRKGYRYKGGSPSDKSNWEKVD
jgi:hypothetical protein